MLHIINEALFSFNAEQGNNEEHGAFSKLSINTSPSIMRKQQDGDEIVPSVRTFARLVSPTKDYHEHKLAVSTKYLENNHVQVLLKSTPEVQYDTTVYLVAFPFNGIILPIPESDQYRIQKGIVSVSEQYSVQFNNRKFKKVLYLMITPKMSLFSAESEDHVDNIPITFHSYSYNKPKDEYDRTHEPKSTHESMTLNISATGCEVAWNKETVPSLDMSQYKGTPLFTLYRKPDRTANTIPQSIENNNHIKSTSFAKAFANAALQEKNNSHPTAGHPTMDQAISMIRMPTRMITTMEKSM